MMGKKTNRGREYVLIIIMFVVVFGCFAAALTTIMPANVRRGTAVDKVSAFDIELKDGFSLVETEGRNGIKYYVITKEETAATSTAENDRDSFWHKVTEAAATTAATTATETGQAAVSTIVSMTVPTDSASEAPSESTTVSAAETTATATTTTTAKAEQSDRRRVAYLTFDDGPSENTEKILDILDQYNVKATFFVIYHKNMESKYKAIVERGHTIALHSYTHNYRKIYASEDAYFDDLTKIHDYVYDVTGVDSKIIRFPGGSSNTISNKYCKGIMKTLKEDVVKRGYSYHDWNVDSTDASGNNRDPQVLLDNVKSRLTNSRKSNILMHDTGKMKQTTVEALPSIIEYIRSEGYEMERITEDSKVIRHG